MKKKIFIAGQEGMVGCEIYNLLKKKKIQVDRLQKKKLRFN